MELSYEKLKALVQKEKISEISAAQMLAFIEQDAITSLPDGFIQRDPRTDVPVVYNLARAKRPHDYGQSSPKGSENSENCAICSGKSTGIVDVAPLSQGYTFINKNLFPMVYPQKNNPEMPLYAEKISGLHFLQWTSSIHDLDWHNMPLADLVIVLARLAALEKWCLAESRELFSTNALPCISFGKNYGSLVGGSLAHGHQQISISSIETLSEKQHKMFLAEYGKFFHAHMQEKNPNSLTIRQYPTARLIVPYFMARPYNMMLIPESSDKKHLFKLSAQEKVDIAQGWQDAIRLIRWIMPGIKRKLAYNVVGHVGENKGVYFEFLPYTQETGCFEHSGLYICQNNPQNCADNLKTGLEYL